MSKLVVVEKSPEIVSTKTSWVELFTATIRLVADLSINRPIKVDKEGKIHFHPSKMNIGEYYPFTFKNKEYLIKKSKENVIDFFEIKK